MIAKASKKDRWLLSYADFVTLLFVVFVMMYAMEKSRAPQTAVVTQPAVSSEPAPAAAPPSLLTSLKANLVGQEKNGFLTLSEQPRGVVITLNDKTLFNPGESSVRQAAVHDFEIVGSVLAKYPNHLVLEGHTDSVPIHNARFRSNWELSTARSIAVMKLLEERANIPPERFSIGGWADNAPVATEADEKGRSRNRRVDIVVLEPKAPPPAKHAD
jgi:chemotaxis protein MotB